MTFYEKAGFFLCCQIKDKGTVYRSYCILFGLVSFLPTLGYTGKLFISPIAGVYFARV
jgi:protoheme IX farnesyltransferase